MRKQAGLNQMQLAARLGADQTFVSRVERGARKLDLAELSDICESCGRDLLDLVKNFQNKN